jgi:NitT/TauT family transport system permease protein
VFRRAQRKSEFSPMAHEETSAERSDAAPAGARGRWRPNAPRQALAAAIVLSIVALVALAWELAARRALIDPFFFSQPSAIGYQLFDWWHGATSRGPLAVHIGITLAEAAFALAAGSLGGAAFAFIFRTGTLGGEVIRLLAAIFAPAPLIAFAAALVFGLQSGWLARAAFAAALVFLVALDDAHDGRPALAALRRRCGLALAGAVLAECFAARAGIGFLIARSVHQFNAAGIGAAWVVLVIVALVVDWLARVIMHRRKSRQQGG